MQNSATRCSISSTDNHEEEAITKMKALSKSTLSAMRADPSDPCLLEIVSKINKSPLGTHAAQKYKFCYEKEWVIRESAHQVKKLCLPKQLRRYVVDYVLSNVAFHLGWERAAAQVKRLCYWRQLDDAVKSVVGTCHACLALKPLLHPQLAPKPRAPAQYPFQRIALGYATGLRKAWLSGAQLDGALAIADALTKRTWILPTSGQEPSEALMQALIERACSVDGLADEWVSDNDSRFASELAKQVMQRLEVKQKLSLPGNARSHGQIERVVGIAEQCILAVDKRKCWAALCPMIQVALSMAKHLVAGLSPRYALRGRSLRHVYAPQDAKHRKQKCQLAH